LNAIILAAGEGKRLRPLTNDKPKGMVQLDGVSILERQINHFRNCNINDISIVTGYKSEKIKFPGITYFKNPKYASTNMVETLFCASKKLSGSVIVSYGDIIFERKIIQELVNEKDDFCVVVDLNWKKLWQIRFENPLEYAESLILDKEGNIINIGQKVSSIKDIQGQYIGLMKFQNEGIKVLKEFYENAKKKGTNPLNPNIPFQKSYMTDLLQGLINAKCKIKSVPIENRWLEIDSYQDYEIYQKKIQDGTISEIINLTK